MHPYTTNSNEYRVINFILAVFSLVSAWLLSNLLGKINIQLWWLDVPSVFGFYMIFHFLFDHYLWKLRIFYKLKIIRIPNLNGSWKGEIESSHDEFQNKYEILLEIYQSWTRISISLKSPLSSSKSEICGINIGDNKKIILTYQYFNEPNIKSNENLQIHRGTSLLYYNQEQKSLEGYYYSGKGRHNHGSLNAIKLSS